VCCFVGVINLVHMINEIKQHHPQVSFADTFQLAAALSIEVRLLSHLSLCRQLNVGFADTQNCYAGSRRSQDSA